MNTDTKKQVTVVINQYIQKKSRVPHIETLQNHQLYGEFFQELWQEDHQEVHEMIRSMIIEEIQTKKTVWGEMFKRYYELHTEEFWKFRAINAVEANIELPEFHTVGQSVEAHLREFEQILTRNMMNKAMGLEKTVSAFYDIAYRYFPFYHRIESE